MEEGSFCNRSNWARDNNPSQKRRRFEKLFGSKLTVLLDRRPKNRDNDEKLIAQLTSRGSCMIAKAARNLKAKRILQAAALNHRIALTR
jgi:hypothetical protein